MCTLDTDVVMEQAVCTYFSLALEQSVEISRRSTEHRRRHRLHFDRHYTTEPNQTVLAWQLEVGQLSTVRFGSAGIHTTKRNRAKPSQTIPYRADTVTNARVNGILDYRYNRVKILSLHYNLSKHLQCKQCSNL